jgi:hypothetical protein
MSQAELNQLEHEVEQARERFTADLARLRSPAIYADFKDDVLAEVRHSKDELVEKTTQAAKDKANRVFSEIKERAAANPAAALAIGAGLAWHLARHPPITSLLVGWGLVSLLRTNPKSPAAGAEIFTRAGEVASSVRDKVEQWGASDTAARAEEIAASAKEKLGQLGSDATEAAKQAASQAASTARSLTRWGENVLHDREERDRYLFGSAALALAAAVGIALQRRVG